jgi:CubicO group peptidase (beta-lactamase class C family)
MTRSQALVVLSCWAFSSVAAGTVPIKSIDEAALYSARFGEVALLVWQDGKTLYERPSEKIRSPAKIFSITKSLVSIGVFRDAMIGGISLGQPMFGETARGVALADLLNQTSGLPSAQRAFYDEGMRDKTSVMRSLPRATQTRNFVYGPSHWEVLAEEIRLTRRTTLDRWLRKYVPGADREVVSRWRRDGKGSPFFSTGVQMSARDLLPAGREVLSGVQGKKWPREVREYLLRGTEANRMYALGFWLNRSAALSGAREVDVESSLGPERGAEFWRRACLSRSAPTDLLAMIGSCGQRVYVVPSQGLIVIRQGHGRGFSDAEFLRRLFSS